MLLMMAIIGAIVAFVNWALWDYRGVRGVTAGAGWLFAFPVVVIATYDFIRRPRFLSAVAIAVSVAVAAYWVTAFWSRVVRD